MKRILHTLLLATAATGLAAAAAQAEGYDKRADMATERYTAMEPSAGYSSDVHYLNSGEIQQIQRSLENEGYELGSIDGIWGPRTSEALRRFQRDNNLETGTGHISSRTLNELGVQVSAMNVAEPGYRTESTRTRTYTEAADTGYRMNLENNRNENDAQQGQTRDVGTNDASTDQPANDQAATDEVPDTDY